VITSDEIESARVENSYDAVLRLRPEFLKRRGAPVLQDPSEGLPVVYLDGVRQGGADALQSIPAGVVLEIRYLTAGAASDRFGPYYRGGVIAVRTRRHG
jgi:hypothetical protein